MACPGKEKYWHTHIGFNYRMTNLQAALGVAQMKHIDQVIERKGRNAAIYHSLLKQLPGLTLPQNRLLHISLPSFDQAFLLVALLWLSNGLGFMSRLGNVHRTA